MAKGNRKHANLGCFLQIRNKCSPKGKKSKYLPDTQYSANKQSKGGNLHLTLILILDIVSIEQKHVVSGNGIVDITKLVETINSLYSDYNYSKKKCKKLNFKSIRKSNMD